MIERTDNEGKSPFAYLVPEQYIALKTFRKSGAGISTPVWFAFDPNDDRKLYVTTDEQSGKVKRLRNNAHVQLAPCNTSGKVHGPEIDANAAVVAPADYARVNTILAKRFGILYQLFSIFSTIRRTPRTYLEITPPDA